MSDRIDRRSLIKGTTALGAAAALSSTTGAETACAVYTTTTCTNYVANPIQAGRWVEFDNSASGPANHSRLEKYARLMFSTGFKNFITKDPSNPQGPDILNLPLLTRWHTKLPGSGWTTAYHAYCVHGSSVNNAEFDFGFMVAYRGSGDNTEFFLGPSGLRACDIQRPRRRRIKPVSEAIALRFRAFQKARGVSANVTKEWPMKSPPRRKRLRIIRLYTYARRTPSIQGVEFKSRTDMSGQTVEYFDVPTG